MGCLLVKFFTDSKVASAGCRLDSRCPSRLQKRHKSRESSFSRKFENAIISRIRSSGKNVIKYVLSIAKVIEVKLEEHGGFWLEVQIVVPEHVFAVELVLEEFGPGAKSTPLSNLFAGTHYLTVEGFGVSPLKVGDTIPAKCFREEDLRNNREASSRRPGRCSPKRAGAYACDRFKETVLLDSRPNLKHYERGRRTAYGGHHGFCGDRNLHVVIF